MGQGDISVTKFSELRKRAETILKTRNESVPKFATAELPRLAHELQIYQVKLELQNEDLKQAQAELAESRNRYIELYDLAPVGYFTLSEKNLIVETNLTAADMLGVERRYLLNQPWPPFIVDADQNIFYQHRHKLFHTNERQTCELRISKKNGEIFWGQLESVPARSTDGALHRAALTDITARKKAEEAREKLVRELEMRVKGLKCLYALSSLIEMHDFSLPGLLEQVVELIPPAWQYPEIAATRLLLNDKAYTTKNFRETDWMQAADIIVNGKKEGKLEVSYLQERPTQHEGPFVREERTLLNVLSERIGKIIERKRSEEERNRIFDMPMALLMIAGPDGSIFKVSSGWEKELGYAPTEMTGKSFFDFIHPDDVKNSSKTHEKITLGTCVSYFENRYRHNNGSYRTLAWSAYNDGQTRLHYYVAQDITDSKHVQKLEDLTARLRNEIEHRKRVEARKSKLEKKLLHAQKMEAVGTLAAGIAHDFNNILNIIFGCVEHINNCMPPGSKPNAFLDILSEQGERAARLVKQIQAFSRQSEEHKQPLAPQQLLKEFIVAQQHITPAAIEVRQRIDPACAAILADPVQLHRVMSNLFVNATQALEEKEGVVELGLREEVVSPGQGDDFDLLPGKYAHLWVSDTGMGIAPEAKEKIFNPYYTTKGMKDGAGLGLAIVYGILTNHDAHINVKSTVGKGTVFDIYFPIIEEKALPEELKEAKELKKPDAARILFVDDEKSNVLLWKMALKDKKFQVSGATNPVDALAMFTQDPEGFDIVITDLKMPDMSGIDLARHIKKIRPNIPIVLATGWRNFLDRTAINGLNIQLIYKPHKINDLFSAIKKAIAKNRR